MINMEAVPSSEGSPYCSAAAPHRPSGGGNAFCGVENIRGHGKSFSVNNGDTVCGVFALTLYGVSKTMTQTAVPGNSLAIRIQ